MRVCNAGVAVFEEGLRIEARYPRAGRYVADPDMSSMIFSLAVIHIKTQMIV